MFPTLLDWLSGPFYHFTLEFKLRVSQPDNFYCPREQLLTQHKNTNILPQATSDLQLTQTCIPNKQKPLQCVMQGLLGMISWGNKEVRRLTR